MIDYIALALGHGLLAIALLRLVMRDGLDSDPLIGRIKAETDDNRQAASASGRNAARRARSGKDAPAHAAEEPPRSSSEAIAQQETRSSSEAIAHKNA
jgi:hypothetical protein